MPSDMRPPPRHRPLAPARPDARRAALALAAALSLAAALAAGCSAGPEGPPKGNALAPGRGASLAGPSGSSASPGSSGSPASSPSSASSSLAAAPSAAACDPAAVNTAAYPWLADRSCASQTVTEPLQARFPPPAGFERAAVSPTSFGAWLRGLPLRPPGPVLDHRGGTVLAAGDPRLAAVVALDEGTADLQQCADSIVRLHAEWLWSRGDRTMSYRAASGTPMPFEKWLSGQRPSPSDDGRSLTWKAAARPAGSDDHSAFRRYLDAVFTWANTGALARDAAKLDLTALAPGDFFVLAGSPGHAVLVLDVARRGDDRVVLLGQGYMPAQSFHVLRPAGASLPEGAPGAAWFRVDPAAGGLQTPFWPAPFPWSSLRRLAL